MLLDAWPGEPRLLLRLLGPARTDPAVGHADRPSPERAADPAVGQPADPAVGQPNAPRGAPPGER